MSESNDQLLDAIQMAPEPSEASSPSCAAGEDSRVCDEMAPSPAAEDNELRYEDFFDNIHGVRQDVSHQCRLCDRHFPMAGLLEIHQQKIHEKPSLLYCRMCNVHFKRKMGLVIHWRVAPSHKSGIRRNLICCDICDAFNIVNGFADHAAVLAHTKAIHGESVLVNSSDHSKSFCPLCRNHFRYRRGMIEHLQVTHVDHLLTHLLGITGPLRDRLMTNGIYKCSHCTKIFRIKKSLSQHLEKVHAVAMTEQMKSHTAESEEKTSSTVSQASDQEEQQAAQQRISKRPAASDPETSSAAAVCPICNKKLPRPSAMKIHLQMVHGGVKMMTMRQKAMLRGKAAANLPDLDEDHGTKDDAELKASHQKQALAAKLKRKYQMQTLHKKVVKMPVTDREATTKLGSRIQKKKPKNRTAIKEPPATKTNVVLFDQSYFDKVDEVGIHAKEFYGDFSLTDAELVESCQVESCGRKFVSYFSMMRHVAFHHRPLKTACLMKLFSSCDPDEQ